MSSNQILAEEAERDAARFVFCLQHQTFPVINNTGDRWGLFVAPPGSTRRQLFDAPSAREAIDKARTAVGS